MRRLVRSAALPLTLLFALLRPIAARAQQMPPGTQHEGAAFTFNKIAEGIYHVVGTGAMQVGANSTVVINDDDVLLVDDHASPAAAAVLMAELKQITNKPLRWVVDTHFHFDHAHGNQQIPPTAQIIGSEFTRQALAAGMSKTSQTWRFVSAVPAQVKALQARLDTTKAPEARAQLERQIKIQQAYVEATAVINPTPPTIAFDHELTMMMGSREVRILFLGRAHTAGDVVVYLPKERILIGGDIVSTMTSNMYDGFVTEWPQTLEELKKLDYDIILPGHGPAFRDTRVRIDAWESYLKDFLAQATALKKAGASVDEAAAKIDLRSHAKDFPQIRAIGQDRDAVARLYDILDGKVK
jgi:glyoxylase-like metal-dependent hydrolase (beta-lactamase superfamily II)